MAETTEKCPFCMGDVKVNTEWFGLKWACPHCGNRFVVGAKAVVHKQTMVGRKSSKAEVPVKSGVKKSMETTTNKTTLVAIVMSSLALLFSVVAFILAMKSADVGRRSAPNEPTAQTSKDKSRTSGKRFVDMTFAIEVPHRSRLKPTMVPSLFNAEKPRAGANFFGVVRITSMKPVWVSDPDELRGVVVRAFVNDNGVWRYSDTMYGYADKNSNVGERLLQLVQDGKDHPCLLRLKPAYFTERGSDYELVDFEKINVKLLE